MPTGKTQTWTKNGMRWIDKPTTRAIDYSGLHDAEAWGLLISYWRVCPDRLLDLLEADNPKYSLEIIQRVIIRAFCTYEDVFVTGTRGLTKTYCVILANLLMGILYPGVIRSYYAPALKQAAAIASGVYREISQQYPALCEYWHIKSDGNASFSLYTDCGSIFSIEVMRGSTVNSVTAEECAQEEQGREFDHREFRTVVKPAVRAERKVNRVLDPFYPQCQKLAITSAGRKTNEAYALRTGVLKKMQKGGNAFCIDIPKEVAILSNIRPPEYFDDLCQSMPPEEQLREFQAFWTGTSENPVVRDSVLSESRNLMLMEDRHCGDPEVIYVIGYDVSYIDGAGNAKCATAVFKCEAQADPYKRDKFLKSLVFVGDNPPPREAEEQARQLKTLWNRFNGTTEPTYIAIDAAAYGKAVLEALHKDLGDGLPPLCCINHDLRELETINALPVVYPVKATAGLGGTHDPDSEMLRYAETQFEGRNVRLLCSDAYEGVAAYKQKHGIKGDYSDSEIALPYNKTKELVAQIGNLKKTVTGLAMKEQRISKHINRDMWSATKYALRCCQVIEHSRLVASRQIDNPWEEEFKSGSAPSPASGRNFKRQGGNLSWR